jgi:lysozyme family protein
MADFKKSLDYVLGNEGGWSNNKNDKGGATKFGITLTTLEAWKECECTVEDIRQLSANEACKIYENFYWDKYHLNLISNDSIATALFDMIINMGPSNAIKLAQKTANMSLRILPRALVVEDGAMGSATAIAINMVDTKDYLVNFQANVKNYYENIVKANPDQVVFLKGWKIRSEKILTLAVD